MDEYDAKWLELIVKNDQAAALVCENYKRLGVYGYMAREVDKALEPDSDLVKVIGPVHDASGDTFRKAASLCEQYARQKASAN
jgi:predicted secreted Zn-dependent protease